MKVTMNAGVEELQTRINARLGRKAEIELLFENDDAQFALDTETLAWGQIAVVSKKAFALTVVAL
jgi:hypothetical protein